MGVLLPVMERFYTVQGEGFNQGKAAWFIRLGGCDVGCVWCDVKDSWSVDAHPVFDTLFLAEEAKASGAKNVVITGGEPLMHNLDALTSHLRQFGLNVWIETSASSPFSGNFDWICVSPKKFKAPQPEILQKANELKVIVFNKSDFAFAESFKAHINPNCKLYLQPEWDKKDKMLPLIIDYIQKNPEWSLSIQSHKYINIQ